MKELMRDKIDVFLLIFRISSSLNVEQAIVTQDWAALWNQLTNQRFRERLKVANSQIINALKEANRKVPKTNQFTSEKEVDTFKFFKHINTNPIIESNQEKKSQKTKQFTKGYGTENLKIIKNINAYLAREAGPKEKSQKKANPAGAPKYNTLPSYLSPVSLKSGIAHLFIFQPVSFSRKVSSERTL